MGNQEGNQLRRNSCLRQNYDNCRQPDIHVTPFMPQPEVKMHWTRHRAGGCPARVVKDPMGENCFLTGPSFLCGKDLLDTGLVTRRLLKAMLNTPSYRLAYAGDEDCRLVDAVPGSFFYVKEQAFSRRGNKRSI